MYILNEIAKEKLVNYKQKSVAEKVGINPRTLSEMIKKDRTCPKITAYCLTKFLDSEAEIENYFIKKGE